MEVAYYKGLLEKLGIQADMMQVGDYKGAAEPLTRDKMSPEFRKQAESVIDDYYSQLATTVAADRKLEVSKVKELIDEGLFTAARAKEVGLIDRVAYEDELTKQLADQQKVDEVTVDDEYGKKKLDEDFSGFGGLVKMFEVLSGGEERGKTSSEQENRRHLCRRRDCFRRRQPQHVRQSCRQRHDHRGAARRRGRSESGGHRAAGR